MATGLRWASGVVMALGMVWAGCADDPEPARPTNLIEKRDMFTGGVDMGGGTSVREDMRQMEEDMAVAKEDMAIVEQDMNRDVDLGELGEGTRRSWVLGKSVEGRPIVGELYGNGGPVLFLLSAIHGDERIAVTFGEQVRATLLGGLAEEAGVQVVFVGHANPDGVEARTRRNANMIDLNRNFDTSNFDPGGPGGMSPLSEPETRVLAKLVEQTGPSAVVSVHCCVPVMDYDGPGEELASQMTAAINKVLRERGQGITFDGNRLGSSKGSMGSFVGVDLKLPIITAEFALTSRADLNVQLEAMHKGGEAAAKWVFERGMENPEELMKVLGGLEAEAGVDNGYKSYAWPTSSGALFVKVDRVGTEQVERPVMVLAGARENELSGLYMAEHLRMAMMSADSQDEAMPPLIFYTAATPEGIVDNSVQVGGEAFGKSVRSGSMTQEARVFRKVVKEQSPRLVVLVEQDMMGPSLQASMQDWALFDPTKVPQGFVIKEEELSGELAQWFKEQGIVVMRVGVDGIRAEGRFMRGEVPMPGRQQVFSEALIELLREF